MHSVGPQPATPAKARLAVELLVANTLPSLIVANIKTPLCFLVLGCWLLVVGCWLLWFLGGYVYILSSLCANNNIYFSFQLKKSV
jgi:hypothetical protein